MIEIKKTDTSKDGVHQLFLEEKKIGEIAYRWMDENTFIITHTEVDSNQNGKGYAKQLLMSLVDFARENNKKIIPLCPYAAVTFKRDKDIQDVLSEESTS